MAHLCLQLTPVSSHSYTSARLLTPGTCSYPPGHAASGEVLGVLGPSGSGKSTLLSILSGTLTDVAHNSIIKGRVRLGDVSKPSVMRKFRAHVAQADVLLPSLTVSTTGLQPLPGQHYKSVQLWHMRIACTCALHHLHMSCDLRMFQRPRLFRGLSYIAQCTFWGFLRDKHQQFSHYPSLLLGLRESTNI